MKKFFFFIKLATFLFLIARIAIPSSARASPPLQTTAAWTGFYFANRNLQGSAVFVRYDQNIDFNWGSDSPGAGIPDDDFSIRWIRWVFIDTPGHWTFTTITDDGARLFIDDALVIDAWYDQPPTAHTATVNLTEAFHLVRMEYYDHGGNAEAHLQILSPSFPDWRGEYYSNPDLAGAPVFVRNDGAINFNFGTAGPGGGIPGTNFSARWVRSQYFNAGRYRFATTTDDGVRLWIDNQLIIDHWSDQAKPWSSEITLTAGNHLIKMEYFQRDGAALAILTWSSVSGTAEIWRGEYFDNPGLAGTPALSRDDADVNFSWGTASPGPGIPSGQNWSARWASRKATNLAGFYTISATADDGVRVWIDDNILIDQWHDAPPTTYASTVFLNSGSHDWRVEFFQHLGAASLRVQITPGVSSPPPIVVPPAGADVIVDDGGAGFFKGGQATAWRDFSGGYGGHAAWMQNHVFSQASYNWARWYPALPHPGFYQVSVYIPANLATTHNARYWIQHAGTYDIRPLNQSLYANQWVVLGAFYFSADGGDYVSLADMTYEPFLSTAVAVDAVRFTPR